jgi:hypothetical protein
MREEQAALLANIPPAANAAAEEAKADAQNPESGDDTIESEIAEEEKLIFGGKVVELDDNHD